MRILVTGGAGFIGSNFLQQMVPAEPQHLFLNVDKMTYAGNPGNLSGIDDTSNYKFERVDITDADAVMKLFENYKPEAVIHFAAESHVDRSLFGPRDFIQTNIVGTFNLLEACRSFWKTDETHNRFHHVSTDEVYGDLTDEGLFREDTPYNPSSPYSASKASSDHLVRAYHRSFGVPVTITNCSNNYGPRQFPEKLVPLMILNALEGKPLPVYGKGENVRDWLYVGDHCRALWAVFEKGRVGETYNIGGECEKKNIDVVRLICRLVAEEAGQGEEELLKLITYVEDRPGHDYRYAMDAGKIARELNARPVETFESGMRKTVVWYMQNAEWVESVRTGAYRDWIDTNYGSRGGDRSRSEAE